LNELGYNAEWRVINAADYGMPQRRRRVFIIGYLKDSPISKKLNKINDEEDWLCSNGVLASAFKVREHKRGEISSIKVDREPTLLSESFNIDGGPSPFSNTGMLYNGNVFTLRTYPKNENEKKKKSDSILLKENQVDNEFFIDESIKYEPPRIKPQIGKDPIVIEDVLQMWRYLKGSKKEWRINKIKKFKYIYAEGAMKFPDDITKSSRTIITGEGGPSPSRFKHVIKVGKKYRRLTPIELERLNMFPDNHTEHVEVTNAKRAFFMGNALVIGVVEQIGNSLVERITR
jgi:DNA (cytosine-5)-methyltransferase 1